MQPSTPSPPADRPANRLAKETSPYLLQHAHNPVDWYPWGPEALARAKQEDKPIFLSIGYAACHWCHVMERESFENPKVAARMNELFVNVKVDREERPDLDEIYMTAVQAFTGSGGWPMSVWLSPDLKPIYGGTYFPPEDRYGQPGFARVLEHVAKLWRERRDDLAKVSDALVTDITRHLAPELEPDEPTVELIDRAAAQSRTHFDPEHGGFGAPPRWAPKFPHASELSLLLRHHARTGDAESLRIAERTLEAMANGGIYDQLGGGFHRYSTDREWLVPHFEKMLYDNALLARTYAEAWQLTRKPLYADVVRETLDWMLREMVDPAGGIWSTQDADSEGVEGKFFVWTKREVEQLLGADDAAIACARWGITAGGNWEHGQNVLYRALPIAEVATAVGKPAEDVTAALDRARAKLLAARERRVRPGTDDKVLAAWNGMAIAALALGHQILGEDRWLHAAQRAADFVLTKMRRDADGRLLRSWRNGVLRHHGYLDDHAFVAEGFLTLFESDFDPRWLAVAQELLAAVREHYRDDADGSFFFTADDHETLVTRSKSVTESSTPSGVAMTVLAALRAGSLLGDEELYAMGARALRANHAVMAQAPMACPSLLLGVELYSSDPREVVVAGDPLLAATERMVRVVRERFPPHHVLVVVHGGNREALAKLSPLVAGKEPIGGATAAYVCRRGVCEAPVTDAARLMEALASRSGR